MKKVLNWQGEGVPGELRGPRGEIVNKPELVAETFHDAMEKKVMGTVREMEEHKESPEEEERA